MRLPVPAEEAWALVTDVRNHARWVPLTRVDAAPALRVGDRFTAVTGPGARRGGPGLPDRMVVERLVPPTAGRPGRARYRKVGPVLLGTAEVGVRPDGEHAELEWIEDVHLRGLPRGATAWCMRPLLGLMLRVVVRRLEAEVRLSAA
ncbi:MAG: SRPBCC family protein [Actinomycetales bacterium]|nr:SRPBCC family protein [Actinomycetales bacterium]